MIKVMIVDDSALIRKLLSDILSLDKSIEVVGIARNGRDALDKIERFKPDVITLDVEMPIMDGLTALKKIVAKHKIPVIMISTLTQKGADLTLKALEEGAVDFLHKPTDIFTLNQSKIREDIIGKVKAAAKASVKDVEPYRPTKKIKNKRTFNINRQKSFNTILAIGTSTGGPRALQTILPEIPADIDAAIVIVQHMPPKFTKSLANRLNDTCDINVKEAEEGDILEKGWVYIAPGDYHMRVLRENANLVIRLNQEPQVMGLRPTVDILMESVAKINNYSKVGIILTGMGSDGARGIIEMKKAKAFTISQDEETSVVYGMPKAAIETDCIDEVLPLNRIANKINTRVGV